jgi:hypothetical protein
MGRRLNILKGCVENRQNGQREQEKKRRHSRNGQVALILWQADNVTKGSKLVPLLPQFHESDQRHGFCRRFCNCLNSSEPQSGPWTIPHKDISSGL